MTNILNELWDGEIHPQDSLIDGNEYYKDLQHLLSRNQADLAETLRDTEPPSPMRCIREPGETSKVKRTVPQKTERSDKR